MMKVHTRRNMTTTLLASCVLVLLAVHYTYKLTSVQFGHCTLKAEATVVDFEYSYSHRGYLRQDTVVFTVDGITYSGPCRGYLSMTDHKGDIITVLYNPDDPSEFYDAGTVGHLSVLLSLIVFMIGSSIVCIVYRSGKEVRLDDTNGNHCCQCL